jgi:Spy/CpxP family protein refolding chaperone
MNRKSFIAAMIFVAITTAARAQEPNQPTHPTIDATPGMPPPKPSRGSLLDENFFPPELLMQHQKAISLTADQETAVRNEMTKMMARFTELQWKQSAEVEKLAEQVRQDRPDEKQVLEQLDKLLAVENEIKRLHTGLLVRVKNILTPEQQRQLRSLTLPHIPPPAAAPGEG